VVPPTPKEQALPLEVTRNVEYKHHWVMSIRYVNALWCALVVGSCLPPDLRASLTPAAWEEMALTVAGRIEQWLADALHRRSE
jgi:hypothetical protein